MLPCSYTQYNLLRSCTTQSSMQLYTQYNLLRSCTTQSSMQLYTQYSLQRSCTTQSSLQLYSLQRSFHAAPAATQYTFHADAQYNLLRLLYCSSHAHIVILFRSAIKKILERDEASSRGMVFCVSSMSPPESDHEAKNGTKANCQDSCLEVKNMISVKCETKIEEVEMMLRQSLRTKTCLHGISPQNNACCSGY